VARSGGLERTFAAEEPANIIAFPQSDAPPPPNLIDEASFKRALADYARYRRGEAVASAHDCVFFRPDGLRFEHALFEFPVSLASARLQFSLHFLDCTFQDPFDARWADLDSLMFTGCMLEKYFSGAALVTRGNVSFSGTTSLSQIDLSDARIQGDLVLIDAKIFYATPDRPGFPEPEVRQGAALFGAGLQVHSILMDRLHCRGRIFLDASRLSGILKAGDAVLERDENLKPKNFRKWDHMSLSVADSDIHGAVILGEEAWGVPTKPQRFHACGQVNLSNSRIRGDLVCTNGDFRSAFRDAAQEDFDAFDLEIGKQDPALLVALNVSRAQIDGGAWLDRDFHACGEVRFDASTVKGTFRCTGATMIGALPLCNVTNEDRGRRHRANFALNLDRVEIGSTLMLDKGFISFGRVTLRNAILHGDLNCEGGTFHACWRRRREDALGEEKERQPVALALSGAEISGSVFLTREAHPADERIGINPLERGEKEPSRRTFRSFGQVRLRGTRIRRNLHLGGGRFKLMPSPADWNGRPAAPKGTRPLIGWFHSASVEGTTFLIEPDRWPVHFCGSMSFAGMQTGGWEDSIACWPQCRTDDEEGVGATLQLNGLTYKTLHGPTRGEERLMWLLHQPQKDLSRPPNGKKNTRAAPPASAAPMEQNLTAKHVAGEPDMDEGNGFKTQPWEQCAAVLHDLGYRSEARFLYRMEQRFIRNTGRLTRLERSLNFVLGTFVGHGYRVLFAVLWATWLVGLGLIVADWGYCRGYIAPAAAELIDKEDRETSYDLPTGYPTFHPFLFSLDTALPAGNVRQNGYWVAIDRSVTAKAPTELAPSPFVRWLNSLIAPRLKRVRGLIGIRMLSEQGLQVVLGCLLGLIVVSLLYWFRIREEVAPRFARSRDFSATAVKAANRLYKQVLYPKQDHYRKRLQSWLMRQISSGMVFIVASVFFVAWSIYLIDRGTAFWLLDGVNGFLLYEFHVSFAHVWFAGETLMGWVLITAVAVALGSTIFHYRRDRL
jgi:hypothetical protein